MPEHTFDANLMALGASIKKHRTERGYTLDQLATRSGVSKGLLSRAENARTAVSFAVLVRVARALDIGVSELVKDVDRPRTSPYIITRRTERTPIIREQSIGYFYEALCSQMMTAEVFQSCLYTLEGNTERELVSNNGDEFLYVISGQIELRFENDAIPLSEGDSIFFDGRQPHVSVHQGPGKAVALVVYLLEKEND
jgi:transcriptional regulator with XRE-family HTH domain